MKMLSLIALASATMLQSLSTLASEPGSLSCYVPTKQKCLYQLELGYCVESAQYEPTPADVDFRDPTNHFYVVSTLTLNKTVKGKPSSEYAMISLAENSQSTSELLYVSKDHLELNVVKIGNPASGSLRIKGKKRDYLFSVSCK